jgi:hypothetical protein
MNPSAANWILKYLSRFGDEQLLTSFSDNDAFYLKLKQCGFIYGVSVETPLKVPISTLTLTQEELTKINLFHSLLYAHYDVCSSTDFNVAIHEIISFYRQLEKGKKGFFKLLQRTSSKSEELEQLLSARLQESNAIIKSNKTSILTFAFLYIDVLAFSRWLQNPKDLKLNAQQLENVVVQSCFHALSAKKKKNKYDRLLIELFESSAEDLFISEEKNKINGLHELFSSIDLTTTEKKYVIDLCCIAVWDDHAMDESEYSFLTLLTRELALPIAELEQSIADLKEFSSKYTKQIKLFEYSNPVKIFYKQSAATVKLLIIRNKKRLLQELDESGELLVLLSQSTIRELSSEEKKKIRDQLLDICKTIPSLTIFLLPGGTVLLPLLIKFIPKLLPSAFNENRIEKRKE